MSGIKNDGPQKPAGNLIPELKQKQEVKKAAASPAVAMPEARKARILPAVQGAALMKQPVKRALPAVPQQKMPSEAPLPKESRPLPKQPVKQVAPVHQAKAAPKPMTGAELKAQLVKEVFDMKYPQLPLEIQAIVTKNAKNPQNLVKEFEQFISSFVAKVMLDSFKEMERFKGSVHVFKERDEYTDRSSNLSFKEKAMKFIDTKSLDVSDFLGAEYFDGGKESVAFRKFSVLFMKSMLPESSPLVRDMGEDQQMANAQMPFLYMLAIANMGNFSQMIEEADANDICMRYDVEDLGVPGNYLTLVPPMIARLTELKILDVGYQGTAYYVPDILLPETMLKLENLREVNLHGMSPVDGDNNEVVKALRARGCKVVFGDTFNQ